MLQQADPVLQQRQDVHALDDAVQREGRICVIAPQSQRLAGNLIAWQVCSVAGMCMFTMAADSRPSTDVIGKRTMLLTQHCVRALFCQHSTPSALEQVDAKPLGITAGLCKT